VEFQRLLMRIRSVDHRRLHSHCWGAGDADSPDYRSIGWAGCRSFLAIRSFHADRTIHSRFSIAVVTVRRSRHLLVTTPTIRLPRGLGVAHLNADEELQNRIVVCSSPGFHAADGRSSYYYQSHCAHCVGPPNYHMT